MSHINIRITLTTINASHDTCYLLVPGMQADSIRNCSFSTLVCKLTSLTSHHTSENFYTYTSHHAIFAQPVRIFYVFLNVLLISVD